MSVLKRVPATFSDYSRGKIGVVSEDSKTMLSSVENVALGAQNAQNAHLGAKNGQHFSANSDHKASKSDPNVSNNDNQSVKSGPKIADQGSQLGTDLQVSDKIHRIGGGPIGGVPIGGGQIGGRPKRPEQDAQRPNKCVSRSKTPEPPK